MMDSIKPFMSSGAEDCRVSMDWIWVWIKCGWDERSYCAYSGNSTQYL